MAPVGLPPAYDRRGHHTHHREHTHPMTSRTPQGRARTRAPRNTLNRERVLEAAVDLLDRAGPDAFTMRALAERLGVATMAVYSHFSGKEEIMDAVRERLLAEVELPAGGALEPREEIRELCLAVYRLLADHPSALRLLATRQVHGDEGMVFADRALAVLLRAGLERTDAARAYTAVMQFTVGAALWVAHGRERQARASRARADAGADAGSRAGSDVGADAGASAGSRAGANAEGAVGDAEGAVGERAGASGSPTSAPASAGASGGPGEPCPDDLRARVAALPPGRYPALTDLAAELETAAREGLAQYERGLRALLAGLLGGDREPAGARQP
jgi:AcrR family transcriptional regulator